MKTYEKKIGITLVEHPLSVQLRTCDTVESITVLVQQQALALIGNEPQGEDRVMLSINNIISISIRLYATDSLRYAIGLVCQKSIDDMCHISDEFPQPLPPPKAICASFAILLAV